MGLDLRQDLRVSQNLVMTPMLQLGVKLLQFNHLELTEHVEQTLLENPLLEKVENTDGRETTAQERSLEEGIRSVERDRDEQLNGQGEGSYLMNLAEERSEYRAHQHESGGTIHDDLPPIETNLTCGLTLAEHLLSQVGMLELTGVERAVLEAVVHSLDDRGYLADGIDEIVDGSGADATLVELMRQEVMELDPIGCGALDLADCLAHQARHHYPEDELFPELIARHLTNLEKRNYAAIGRDLEIELEDVIEYHKMLQHFDPHPGMAHSIDAPRYILPDVFLVRDDGEWRVLLNESGLPELKVSAAYREILARGSRDDRAYLEEKSRSAEFYIRSIHRRRRTIQLVMESILRLQADFFVAGDPERLRPMVLQDVADDVHAHILIDHYHAMAELADRDPYSEEPEAPGPMHMSTVSRVTSNKFVDTPFGIFELKYFFTAKVRQSSGEDVSAQAIKSRIRDIVKDEDATKPLSDQAIANILKEEGTRVARRTVAKYREALGILPSATRKQLF
ncbi:MAG: RNA polymerase sigma-54 factor [Deltaproteobacteria bacterium]|nr:RNA polymerase sigma-54 factor [Deltaproteobacteria bacterium]